MRGLSRKSLLTSLFSLCLVISAASQASVNPFKKSKNYKFGNEVVWYENAGSAIKSGSSRDGSDTNYYHLNIDKHRLLLRLGKNDPSGELENTRMLDALAITDVKADGRRLPIFDWCLINQQYPTKKLKQNSVVANDKCVNAGGNGDFVINLDDQTRNILQKAKTLEFVIEPYGRPLSLSYSMQGYAAIMAKINRPAPAPVVKKPVAAPVVVNKPKPKPKPVPVARPKPVKLCYAKPPIDFKSAVPAMSYPCGDAAKQSEAEIKISARVENEKKKMAAELEAAKLKQQNRQQEIEDNAREKEWDKQQEALWIKRCERHWKKGGSPCYCEKFLDRAPPGVNNTCGK